MSENIILHLSPVEDGLPEEGRLIIVRQKKGDKVFWRISLFLQNQFLLYDHNQERTLYILDERMITHWGYLE